MIIGRTDNPIFPEQMLQKVLIVRAAVIARQRVHFFLATPPTRE